MSLTTGMDWDSQSMTNGRIENHNIRSETAWWRAWREL